MRQTIRTFKALSDPNRIRILKMLEVKPLCVCEITDVLELATSTVSKHLSLLREAGFIIDEKDGKWVNYQLDETEWNTYARELRTLLTTWLNDDDTIQSDKKKIQQIDRYVICSTETE